MQRSEFKKPEWRHGLALALVGASLAQARADEGARAQFTYAADDVASNLVVIECESKSKKSTGCGFVALMEGKPYLVTNQHIILGADKIGFVSPSGRVIKPRSVELSASRDIARMALAEGDGFALSSDWPIGAPIGVFGGGKDKKKTSELYGEISGIGADRIEVSANFAEDNSGSPVLNLNQEVVAIASHVRESSNHAMKKGTKFENKTRRFCYRLDGVGWIPVSWKSYNQKYGVAYHESRELLDSVIEILNSWADGPLEQVRFEDQPYPALTNWVRSHNQVVSKSNDGFERKFYAEYSESTQKLAEVCRSQARKIRMLSKQRDPTAFLLYEFDMQAGTFEYVAKIIDRYSTTVY
ncbi:hypothetical protein SCARR_01750 [Pontiella sulfatireligans]|uniref:Uncharacterized protein n=2 Tax=Pontiella sulfatireligans TaxID=2750658 RepID=A0A6C2UJV4_9BACT|nr:hypothetical protein SCARR_01750 [Pontiella sulfatireligans]